jgi:hypothetical protein
MAFQWSDYLEIARFLHAQGKASNVPEEAAFRCSISRAYYAAFCHSCSYATARLQFKPQGSDDDHKNLRRHIWKRGLRNESAVLDRLRQWRNQCDYHNPISLATDANVQSAISDADTIVSSLQLP